MSSEINDITNGTLEKEDLEIEKVKLEENNKINNEYSEYIDNDVLEKELEELKNKIEFDVEELENIDFANNEEIDLDTNKVSEAEDSNELINEEERTDLNEKTLESMDLLEITNEEDEKEIGYVEKAIEEIDLDANKVSEVEDSNELINEEEHTGLNEKTSENIDLLEIANEEDVKGTELIEKENFEEYSIDSFNIIENNNIETIENDELDDIEENVNDELDDIKNYDIDSFDVRDTIENIIIDGESMTPDELINSYSDKEDFDTRKGLVEKTPETTLDGDNELNKTPEYEKEPIEIGIDLGTTNSVISYFEDGKIKFVKDKGSELIPSNIFYKDRENIYYGKKAKKYLKGEVCGFGITNFKQRLKADSEKIHIKVPKINKKNSDGYSYYVIDTNVFIDCPDIIEKLDDDEKVILPITVEQEIEYLLNKNKEKMYSAEKALDQIVKFEDKIEFSESDLYLLPDDFFKKFPKETGYAKNNDNNDNKILSIAIKNRDKNVTLISTDRKLSKLKSKFVNVNSMTLKEFLNIKSNVSKYDEFDITGTEASAMFLTYLKEKAEMYIGRKVNKAVITIPATFNFVEIENTKEAGLNAGFDEVHVEKEPTAAAIAYNLDKKEDNTVFVYDFGGGTFDISIIKSVLNKEIKDNNEYFKQKFEICATAGNSKLGGEDLTEKLVEEIYDYLEDEYNLSMYSEEESCLTEEHYYYNKNLIYWAAETCKLELSDMEETQIILSDLYIDDDTQYLFTKKLNREELERIIKPIIGKAILEMNNALSRANMYKEDPNDIIMAGGTSMMPSVQKQVKQYFGKDVFKDRSSSTLIAEGAAIIANKIYGDNTNIIEDINIFDKTNQDFGVALENCNYGCIIPGGSELPASAEKKYSLIKDNQNQINIKVFSREMNSQDVVKTYDEGIEYLDEIILRNLPPMKMDEVEVIVKFEINEKYELEINVKLVKKDGTLIDNGNIFIDRHSMNSI